MTELLVAILILVILARVTGELMQRIGQLAILGELLVGIVLGAIIAYGPFTQFAGLADNEVFGAMTCSWRCSIISELFASSHDMKNEKAPFLK